MAIPSGCLQPDGRVEPVCQRCAQSRCRDDAATFLRRQLLSGGQRPCIHIFSTATDLTTDCATLLFVCSWETAAMPLYIYFEYGNVFLFLCT